MWPLILAFIGLVGPNGLFLYWLFYEYPGLSAVLENHLAVAFMIDAFMALGLLSYLFAIRPVGRVRWPWFVVLFLVGGLGFRIPFYIWLNRRPANRLPEDG